MPEIAPDPRAISPNAGIKGGKPAGATPYRANGPKFIGKQTDIASLAPPREAEPESQKGIDLSGRAKIIFAAGRGKTGKTTCSAGSPKSPS